MSSKPSVIAAPSAVSAASRFAPHVGTGLTALALYSAAHFFIDLYSSALGAFQPVLVEKLRLSLTQAAWLGSMMTFSGSFVQPAYGFLSDRYHSRMFSALAPGVAGLFISMLGVAPNYFTALLLVALGAAGIASFHPQASARATLGVKSHRGRWMAVFISAGSLGLSLGPAYFSAILANLGAARSYIAGAPGMLMTILLLARLPEMPAPAGPRKAFDWGPLRAVWKPMSILYTLVVLRSAVQIVFGQFLPLYLHRERGFTLVEASLALTLYLAAGALGGFVGGHMADRYGGKRVILFSMMASVPFLLGFFLLSGWPSMICLALGGWALLFTIPVNVVMAQELAPGQAGTVSALMMGFAWGFAGLLFIPITGWVGQNYSLHTALTLLTACPLAGAFLTLTLPADRKVRAV